MGHSTGAEGQLDRIKPATFGSAEYAREELVAELTAALTAQRYGMTKHLKRRFGCLFEVLAGFAEGVAAVHQDHATRCEKSYLNAHAAYRQDCYGDRPGEKRLSRKTGKGKVIYP